VLCVSDEHLPAIMHVLMWLCW